MKIAVLMSTYNGQKYLDEQLMSIADQTFSKMMTLYIRDDGSTDNTLKIIEKWKKKIDIVFFQGENVGPARSFWKLLMNSEIQADYYAFCDQDDIWDLDKLERGVDSLKEEVHPALWCSNCRIINGEGKILQKKMNECSPNFAIDAKMVCCTTQGCATLFNNKLRQYLINRNLSGKPMHDFVVMTYAIAIGKVIYDEEPSFGYRVHENNVVAKEGKGILKRTKLSINRWFSSDHKNELSNYINIFISDNKKYLLEDDIKFLENIAESPHHFFKRIKVINSCKCRSFNKRAERSFKIRTILGVI